MRSFFKSLYEPRQLDLVFGLLAAAAIAIIFLSGGEAIEAIPAVENSWIKSLALIGAALISTLLATKTTDCDQRLADDFVYQTLAKSALVTVASTILFYVVWQFAAAVGLGEFSSEMLFAVMLLIWAAAYFLIRAKGTTA